MRAMRKFTVMGRSQLMNLVGLEEVYERTSSKRITVVHKEVLVLYEDFNA